jgi:hypothetical protein
MASYCQYHNAEGTSDEARHYLWEFLKGRRKHLAEPYAQQKRSLSNIYYQDGK